MNHFKKNIKDCFSVNTLLQQCLNKIFRNIQYFFTQVKPCFCLMTFCFMIVMQIYFINFFVLYIFYTAVDGGWTGWTGWSACSITCGSGGVMKRLRYCENPPREYGGQNCEGPSFDVQSCHAPHCGTFEAIMNTFLEASYFKNL